VGPLKVKAVWRGCVNWLWSTAAVHWQAYQAVPIWGVMLQRNWIPCHTPYLTAVSFWVYRWRLVSSWVTSDMSPYAVPSLGSAYYTNYSGQLADRSWAGQTDDDDDGGGGDDGDGDVLQAGVSWSVTVNHRTWRDEWRCGCTS